MDPWDERPDDERRYAWGSLALLMATAAAIALMVVFAWAMAH